MKRFLLLVDFLGFSHKIQEQSLPKSAEYYAELLRYLYPSLSDFSFPIKFQIISDSVFVWIESENEDHQLALLCHAASNLIHNSIAMKHFVRGAIVYDEFFIGDIDFPVWNSPDGVKRIYTILGKGIIKSNEWEKIQNWVGISIHPEAIELLETKFKNSFFDVVSANELVNYSVPTKDGNRKTYVVNYLSKGHDEWLTGKLNEELATSTREDIRQKINNTLEFIEYIRSIEKFTLRPFKQPEYLKKLRSHYKKP